jgi:hypothetical protein
MGFRRDLALAAASVGVIAFAGNAQATIVTVPQSALIASTNYYTDTIGGGIGNVVVTTGGGNAANVGAADGRNDDGFSLLNLGFTINYFGTNYTSLYINNNGSVSFGAGISAYIPTGPTGASAPIISPFFDDVDTRNPASGVVHVRTDIANEVIVTWDNVGYYSTHGAPLDSFQLVLRSSDYVVPVGEGVIGFFYETMGWDSTDTSHTAAIGFGDGAGNGEVLAGSNTAGMAAVVNDTHIWFDPNLAPVEQSGTVPEPSGLALVALGLIGCWGVRRRKSA